MLSGDPKRVETVVVHWECVHPECKLRHNTEETARNCQRVKHANSDWKQVDAERTRIRGEILRLVVGQGMTMAAAGRALGVKNPRDKYRREWSARDRARRRKYPECAERYEERWKEYCEARGHARMVTEPLPAPSLGDLRELIFAVRPDMPRTD